MSTEYTRNGWNNFTPRVNQYEAELRQELAQCRDDAEFYLHTLNNRYRDSVLDVALNDVTQATLVDETGNSLAGDHPGVVGFRGGALIGLSVAEKALPPNDWGERLAATCGATSSFARASFGELDGRYQRFQAREEMIRQAAKGLSVGQAYGEVVMSVGREIFPEESLILFQYGFGFVLHNTAKLLASHDEFRQEADLYVGTDADQAWDEATRRLLGR